MLWQRTRASVQDRCPSVRNRYSPVVQDIFFNIMLLSIWCDGMLFGLKGVFHPMCLLVAVLSSHPYGPLAVVRFACYLGDGSMYFSYHTFYFLHKKNLHTWISFDVHHPISPTITARLVLYHQIDAEAIPDLRMSNKKD